MNRFDYYDSERRRSEIAKYNLRHAKNYKNYCNRNPAAAQSSYGYVPQPPSKYTHNIVVKNIQIIGVGACGIKIGNYVNQNLGCYLTSADSDIHSLYSYYNKSSHKNVEISKNDSSLELGKRLTAGYKTIVIIITNLAGEIGSEASPKIVEYVKNNHGICIVLGILPFKDENVERRKKGENTLKQVQAVCDNVFVIDNEKCRSNCYVSKEQSMEKANQVARGLVSELSNSISTIIKDPSEVLQIVKQFDCTLVPSDYIGKTLEQKQTTQPLPTQKLNLAKQVKREFEVIAIGHCGLNLLKSLKSSTSSEKIYCSCLCRDVDFATSIKIDNIVQPFYSTGHQTACINDLQIHAHLSIMLTGLGGRTSSLYAPLIADYVKKNHGLLVTIIASPFHFEGGKNKELAKDGLEKIIASCPVVITVNNNINVELKTPFSSILSDTNNLITKLVKEIYLIRQNLIAGQITQLSEIVRSYDGKVELCYKGDVLVNFSSNSITKDKTPPEDEIQQIVDCTNDKPQKQIENEKNNTQQSISQDQRIEQLLDIIRKQDVEIRTLKTKLNNSIRRRVFNYFKKLL